MNAHNLRPTNRLPNQSQALKMDESDPHVIVDTMQHFIDDTAGKLNTLQRNSHFNQLQLAMHEQVIGDYGQ